MVQTTRICPKKRKRKEKSEKDVKSVEERTLIVAESLEKLIEVHLAAVNDDGSVYSVFEGIQEFVKVLEEYKKPGLLSGFSGVIKVPELNRNIEYILPLKKMAGHGVRLVSNDVKNYEV